MIPQFWYMLRLIGNTALVVLRVIGAIVGCCLRPFGQLIAWPFRFPWEQRRRMLVIVVSLLAIIGSARYYIKAQRGQRATLNVIPFEIAGQRLAEETARALNEHGTVVIWNIETTAGVDNRMIGVMTESFQRCLRGHRNVRIVATERFLLDEIAQRSGVIPTPMFFERLLKHPEAQVVVSFAGVPVLQPEDFDKLPKSRPQIILAWPMPTIVPQPRLFAEGVVHLAVLPRTEPLNPPRPPPTTAEEQFEQYFVVYR